MEALAEQVVGTYLTQGGKVFICPSYSIKYNGNEWSCPDFVALDFDKQEVVVVEVTTASNVSSILSKIQDRDQQWLLKLREQLTADHIAEGWDTRVLCFVRRENLKKAEREFDGIEKVTFAAIEDATFSWDYWKERKGGLPR
jgi:hypothetical protein